MGKTRQARPLALVLISLLLVLSQASGAQAAGPAVRGGGVVDGDLGTTSQLGFTATNSGGSFLCVMAGRSGGFPFGPWQSVLQMHVQGRVTPGTLEFPAAGVASFEGLATIHVIGTTASGRLAVTLTDVPFISTQSEGGAGVARHLLQVPGIGDFGPASMKTGHISIWP